MRLAAKGHQQLANSVASYFPRLRVLVERPVGPDLQPGRVRGALHGPGRVAYQNSAHPKSFWEEKGRAVLVVFRVSCSFQFRLLLLLLLFGTLPSEGPTRTKGFLAQSFWPPGGLSPQASTPLMPIRESDDETMVLSTIVTLGSAKTCTMVQLGNLWLKGHSGSPI